ncbi:hypothetical protein GCM10009808_11210 [Microbacterium sediminicola]|uniref:Surface-anchored protein n=1 Tax=Microbacterium sediminicola TaxID=415210 RepID=A0ABN2HYN4_9MICO
MHTSTFAAPTRRTPLAALSLLLAASVAVGIPTSALADTSEDPALDQTIEQGQEIVHGDRVLSSGHVDMGPRFDDGVWTLLIHDDVARADESATSVWRYPSETVFQITDAGILTAPDDPAYEFLGVDAGESVWVSPQTQNPDVVWIGWNTQDPEVMAAIDRGVTLTLDGVEGPGTMTVFLQSGSFGEPDVLWDSRVAEPQPLWVDVNTHTHANWAFTEPGVYLVELTASADLVDGSTVSDTQILRFAVGSQTDTDAALTATWAASDSTDASTDDTDVDADTGEDEAAGASDPVVPILITAIAVVAIGLVVGIVVVLVRGSRTKRAALSSRAPEHPGGEGK